MLFLLRKIRRKLMQKNKFTTYLLYAIGEIVLVVIGILIAVSLNNWNQNQQALTNAHQNLTTIHSNLLLDIDEIQRSINEIHRFQKNLTELEYRGTQYSKDSLLLKISQIHRVVSFEPVAFGYQKMSGEAIPKSIPDSLLSKLSVYYTRYSVGLNDTSYEDLALYSLNKYRDYLIKKGFPIDFPSVLDAPKDINILKKIIIDPEFIGIIRNTNFNRGIQLMGFRDALKRARSCKEDIEHYFKYHDLSY